MNIVVLLAGIVDTNWPLRGLELGPDGGVSGDEKLPRKLSPFDEAALETALQLRARNSEASITALLFGEVQSEQLLRTAAAHRLQALFCVEHDPARRWDVNQVAQALKNAIDTLDSSPDLVLIGREFGDTDDGSLPSYLAEVLGWRFVSMAQEITYEEGALNIRRVRGNADEWLRLTAPAIASITNDKTNRLRHPLLKNVMLAKRESFGTITMPRESAPPRLKPRAINVQEATRRSEAARTILSGPIESQIAELAAYLKQWRSPA